VTVKNDSADEMTAALKADAPESFAAAFRRRRSVASGGAVD